MTDDASSEAAGDEAGGPLPAAPVPGQGLPEAPAARRSIFDLRAVTPLSPEERAARAAAMERSLAFGAEPVRDERGWALEVDFIEANGEAVEPWKHDRRDKRLYKRNQKVTKAAGQLIGQPGDKIEWAKRLAALHHREGSDIEGAVRRGLFDAIWRYDHVYDGYTVPRRYGTHFMKTGRVAAVAEEQRRKWIAEGRAPADAFWVRNRRNTGLVLVSPNPDPDAPTPETEEIMSAVGAESVTGQADAGDDLVLQIAQAKASPSPPTADSLFKTFRGNLTRWEGGIANRPFSADPGGITNQGISKAFLDNIRKLPRYNHLPSDPRALTDAQIDTVYRAENFERPQLWKLAQVPNILSEAPELVELMFDAGVQHGLDNPGIWLQEALDETLGTDLKTRVKGKLAYDGIIGSGTRKIVEQAVKTGKIEEVNNLVVDKRIAYMRSLSNFSSNPGWIARAESFRINRPSP